METTTAKRIEIFKDEYSGEFKIDYCPDSSVIDRRAIGYSTLKEARDAVHQRAWELNENYKSVYVGSR